MLRALSLLLLAASAFAQDWAGRWEGELVNYPVRPNTKPVRLVREIGEFPRADGACSPMKTTYTPDGAPAVVKDYRLCRGQGAADLFIDEGDGIKLQARLLDDTLISTFKFNKLILVSILRRRGDALEEDIFTATDQPAIEGALSLETRGLQRLRFRRAK